MGSYAWEEPRTWIPVTSGSPAEWLGGTVYLSRDGGTTWEALGTQREHTPTATANAALGSAIPSVWDSANSLTVSMMDPTFIPVSLTQAEVTASRHANRLLIETTGGYELIAYASAVPDATEPTQIDLSGFLRGLNGTGDQVGNHFADAQCWFLNGRNLFEIQWAMDDVSRTLDGGATYDLVTYKLKVVPFGGNIDDFPAFDYTPYRTSLKPRAPTNGRAWLRSNGDMELAWDYVSRDPKVRAIGSSEVRFLEAMDGPSNTFDFWLDIRDGSSNGRTVSSVQVTRADMLADLCYDYTAAEQTADSSSAPFTVTVRCNSEIYDANAPSYTFTTPS